MAGWFDDWYQDMLYKTTRAIEAVKSNVIYGTLSEHQAADLVEQEAQDLVKASGGALTLEEARRIARGDVTKVLVANNAHPSQASLANIAVLEDLKLGDLVNLKWWLLGGVGALGLVLVLRD